MTTLRHPRRRTVEVFTDENGRVFEWQHEGFDGTQWIATMCECGNIISESIIMSSSFAILICFACPKQFKDRERVSAPKNLVKKARNRAWARNSWASDIRHAGGGSGAAIPI